MGIETADDLLDFFELDDFAIEATYTPFGGSPTTILGIFDSPRASRQATEMLEIESPQPRFMCRTVDVPNVAEDDELTISGADYIVRANVDDGLGITTLILEAA